MRRRAGTIAFVAAMLIGWSGSVAFAGDPITISITDSFAPDYYYHDLVTRPFVSKVERRTHEEVRMPLRAADPRGSGTAMLEAVQANDVDIGTLAPDNLPGGMPLLSLAEYAGWNASTCRRSARLMRLSAAGGLIARTDFEPNGLHRILIFLYPDYPIVQVDDAAHFTGRRIRTTTAGADEALVRLGAIPVRIPNVASVPAAVREKRLDGVLLPYRTVVASGLAGQLRSTNPALRFGSVILVYAMSEKRWQALSTPAKLAIDRAAWSATRTTCRSIDMAMRSGESAARRSGIKFSAIPADRLREFNAVIGQVRAAAAGKLDAAGLPGSRAIRNFDAPRP